jgi:hypothetical protein
MSDEHLRPLWDKVDSHEKALSSLAIEQAVHKQVLNMHSNQIDHITRDNAARHAELKTLISQYSERVDTVLETHNKREGAEGITRWLVPVLLTLVGVLIAFQNLGS